MEKKNENTFEFGGVTVVVKPYLSMQDTVVFVDSVVDSCFQEKRGYCPEFIHMAIRVNMIGMYTDYKLPDGAEEQNALVYGTDICDRICKMINESQFDELCNAIYSKVEYRVDSDISGIQRRADEAVSMIESVMSQMKELFGDIKPEDMKGIVGAISNGGIDEEKLVDAYMKKSGGKKRKAKPEVKKDGDNQLGGNR